MKPALSVIAVAFLISIGIVLSGSGRGTAGDEAAPSAQNVDMRNGVQYITIYARGGYSPRASAAQANVPTKLIVKTNGTYDCSAALVIRSIGYRKILPQTGEEIIDLGTPQAGILRGVCSMGMYGFSITFK